VKEAGEAADPATVESRTLFATASGGTFERSPRHLVLAVLFLEQEEGLGMRVHGGPPLCPELEAEVGA